MKKLVIVSCILSAAAIFTVIMLLRGAGVTADELLAKVVSDSNYIDAYFNIDYEVDTMSMITDVTVKSSRSNKTQNIEGNINTSVYGIVGNKEHSYWIVDDTVYQNNEETKVKDHAIDLNNLLSMIKAENFKSYKLEDNINNTEYCITAQLTEEKFKEFLNNVITTDLDILNLNITPVEENVTYQLRLVFTRNKDLQYIQFTWENTEKSKFKFIIRLDAINNVSLDMPR